MWCVAHESTIHWVDVLAVYAVLQVSLFGGPNVAVAVMAARSLLKGSEILGTLVPDEKQATAMMAAFFSSVPVPSSFLQSFAKCPIC